MPHKLYHAVPPVSLCTNYKILKLKYTDYKFKRYHIIWPQYKLRVFLIKQAGYVLCTVFLTVTHVCVDVVIRMIWLASKWPTRYIIWVFGEVSKCFDSTTSVRPASNDARLPKRLLSTVIMYPLLNVVEQNLISIDFCTIHSGFYYCICAYCSFVCVYFYDDVSGWFTILSIKLIGWLFDWLIEWIITKLNVCCRGTL